LDLPLLLIRACWYHHILIKFIFIHDIFLSVIPFLYTFLYNNVSLQLLFSQPSAKT
jgi:hypothetical protein